MSSSSADPAGLQIRDADSDYSWCQLQASRIALWTQSLKLIKLCHSEQFVAHYERNTTGTCLAAGAAEKRSPGAAQNSGRDISKSLHI